MKNWELILADIVKSKNMNPYDINARKLASAYSKRIKKMNEHGIRITAPMRCAERVLEEMAGRGERSTS